jgi:copper chaperone CopZ
MKKISMSIIGMHCASCSANVEKSLKKVSGIKNASISLLFKKGSVEAEDFVKEEDIKSAVKRVGYEAKDFKLG